MPLKEPQNRRRQARITVKEFEEVSKRRSRSEKVKTDVEKRKDPGQKQQADKQRNSHPLCLVYIIWFEKTAKQLHKREKRKRQPSAPLLMSMPLPLNILLSILLTKATRDSRAKERARCQSRLSRQQPLSFFFFWYHVNLNRVTRPPTSSSA